MILASFYRHVSATNDEVTAMLGGVKLQMVCGDIVHESTDVIINTTDFSNNQSGMIDGSFWMCLEILVYMLNFGTLDCYFWDYTHIIYIILTKVRYYSNCVFTNSTGVSKAILTAAGATVQAELAQGKP